MTVGEALRAAADHLSATSDSARLDAELLMAHALNCSRSDMLLRHQRDPAPDGFEALVDRRARHEPIAYITGEQEFYGRCFAVRPGVLIPRGDSETLVRAALESCSSPRRVLDLGTGSGALLLTLLSECPAAAGVGIDASSRAIEIATENARALDLANDWRFERRSWLDDGWQDDLGRFDLVVCNPPYVEADALLDADVHDYEPGEALFAGPEGLDDYRVLIPKLPELLAENGVAIFEIGHQQAESVAQIASEAGFSSELRRDLAGRPRALILRPKP